MALSLLTENQNIILPVTTSSNQSSKVINIQQLSGYSVQTTFTGSPSGTLTINGSNDGINFSVVQTQAVSSSGTYLYNTYNVHYIYVQVNWVGSGTGTITSIFTAKDLQP